MEFMKQFKLYQYLEGDVMTERDKSEVGSKYWNEGKWNNFIVPFLPKHCEKNVFIDVGCNAGLFLKLAKEKGFDKIIGIEPDKETYNKAIKYRGEDCYQLINNKGQDCIDILPVADVTLFANSHYYIPINDFKKYIKKLKERTVYCIIVTVKKQPNDNYAPSNIEGIRCYFKDWKEIKTIHIKKDNTPYSREMTSICFKSPLLERISIDILDNGNEQQRNFYEELDRGLHWSETDYYRRMKSYRRHSGSRQEMWSEEKLNNYMQERVDLYEDIKKNGLKDPLKVKRSDNRITDGNHRHRIAKHLNYKTIKIIYE